MGLKPRRLPTGTGLVCEVGIGEPVVVLRADIDALPLADLKDVPYASTKEGLCHACGHDVHTTIVLGVAMALAGLDGLPGRVRCIFQPAEETLPGGATEVVASGVLDGAPGRSPCTATRRCRPGRSACAPERSPPPVTGSTSPCSVPAATPPVRSSPSTSSTPSAG